MLKTIYFYVGILLTIIQIPLFITSLVLFLGASNLSGILLFLLMSLLMLQPTLSIFLFKRSNKFSTSIKQSMKKWLYANTIFTSIYTLITVAGTLISLASFGEIKELYKEAMLANEITDTIIRYVLYFVALYSLVFFLHCVATFIFLKRLPTKD